MAVSQRAQVPTPAQRRAAALETSRPNLTLLVLVRSVVTAIALSLAVTTGSGSSEGGGTSLAPGLFGVVAVFCVCFAAAAGGAAFVLSALRDAALAEG